MIDYGALPPEITSGRMYVGAGVGPMLAAAAAWDELAIELQCTAASYRSTIETLTVGSWLGSSSVAMASAAAPYEAWISATGALAEQAATQAKLAAGAYETAFAATVPPPVIAANRATLVALITTNFFGQNTAAIAATEAEYAQMWAQDAAAMYTYASASATFTQLTPFTEPPSTTTSTAALTQSTAIVGSTGQLSQLVAAVPHALSRMATTAAASLTAGHDFPPPFPLPTLPPWLAHDIANWDTIMSALTGPYSLLGVSNIPGRPFLLFGRLYAFAQTGQSFQTLFAPAKPITGALAPIADLLTPQLSAANVGANPVSGVVGRAALAGSLSVPPAWTQAVAASPAPAAVATAVPVSAPAGQAGVFEQMAMSSIAGCASTHSSGTGGGAARPAGDADTEADPAAATIIVIPAFDD
ncbi:PPE family protein [Mycobacterium simiae]|uniref:PPE family protein n=1 Tax=Mycobacterium simiae TaxID=1784 RepID=A0A5B1BRU2_MYCSI|nr:PPE family protein [Mycobacterium simiae]KAA1250495.1 PPE family protein [Mycobacterium simiae]